MSTYFNGGFYAIRGYWSSFYRRFSLNEELNIEWKQINEEIWVRFSFLFCFLTFLFLNFSIFLPLLLIFL